ncbi:MAG: hypothetical protein ACP5NP_16270 [Acetobacteraceae bacterium]
MIRMFLIVVTVGLLVAAGGFFALGLFPPQRPPHPVTVVLPAAGIKG